MLFRLATIFIQHLLNQNSFFFFTLTHNDRGYRGCISLRLGACYALRFTCLKTDKLQLCVNIPINSLIYIHSVMWRYFFLIIF